MQKKRHNKKKKKTQVKNATKSPACQVTNGQNWNPTHVHDATPSSCRNNQVEAKGAATPFTSCAAGSLGPLPSVNWYHPRCLEFSFLWQFGSLVFGLPAREIWVSHLCQRSVFGSSPSTLSQRGCNICFVTDWTSWRVTLWVPAPRRRNPCPHPSVRTSTCAAHDAVV